MREQSVGRISRKDPTGTLRIGYLYAQKSSLGRFSLLKLFNGCGRPWDFVTLQARERGGVWVDPNSDGRTFVWRF